MTEKNRKSSTRRIARITKSRDFLMILMLSFKNSLSLLDNYFSMKYKHIVMVGDGATDAEACPPADAFIGFGGNQVRDPVKKISPWYVYDFQTLSDEISCPDNLKN